MSLLQIYIQHDTIIYWNISSDILLIYEAEVVVLGIDSITLAWKKKEVASNIRNITTSATWISDHGDASKRSPEFRSTGTIGLMKGIEAGDVGSVCLKTQVFDIVGRLTNILTYIQDIRFGRCIKVTHLSLSCTCIITIIACDTLGY